MPPSTEAASDDAGWVRRPWVARGVRTLVVVAPLPATLLSSYLVARLWPRPSGTGALTLWWMVLLASAGAVSMAVERSARRLLPLATLLRLSLVFPDATPSRFRVALRDGNPRRLERRLAHGSWTGPASGGSETAAALLGLMTALAAHDRQTRGHSERVRAYSMMIGDELGLDAASKARLQWGALLHDIGKMAVPSELLNKVEPLSDVEFGAVRAHPAAAHELLEPLAGWLGEWRFAATQHHERFDGRGYPAQLIGTDTALAARIVAVADAYDVMTTARSYKKPQSREAARRELAQCAGSQFDPVVVRAFLSCSIGSLRRSTVPLAWLGQLSYVRTVATSTMATLASASGLLVGMSISAASATESASPVAPTAVTTVSPLTNVGGTIPATTSAPTLRSDARSSTRDSVTAAAATTSTAAAAPASSPTEPVASAAGDAPPPPPSPSSSTPPPPAATTSMPAIDSTEAPVSSSTTATTVATTACEQLRAGATRIPAADLRGCDLSGRTLSGLDLTGALLTGADLRNATLDQSSFNQTVLVGADLRGAHITNVGFEHADLTNARLDGVWADQVGFAGATLRGAHLSSMFISRGNFDGADLSASVADHLRAGGITMYDANLTGATLDHSDLSGTRLDRARFDQADLTVGDLRGATLQGASFANAFLDGANLSGASGTPVTVAGARWTGTTCPTGSPAAPACWP